MSCCAGCASRPSLGELGAFEPACLTMWPSDIRAEKARIDALMRTTDVAVQGCDRLGAGDRASWSTFYTRWRVFADQDVGIFAANECATAIQYGRDLAGWQATIRARCAVPGPDPNAPANQGPIDPGTIRWVVAGVGLLSVAVVVRTLFR